MSARLKGAEVIIGVPGLPGLPGITNAARVYPVTAFTRAAIQTQIDAAGAAGGGTVFLPRGTYAINDHNADSIGLDMPLPGVHLVGEDRNATILRLDNAANANVVNISGAGCGVRSLTVDGNRANQTVFGHAVRIQADDVRIIDVYGKDAGHYGLGIGQQALSRVRRLVVDRCRFSGSGGDAIDFKNKISENADNLISNVVIDSFGVNAAMTAQAGIDCRGPVRMVNVYVNGVNVDKVGIRFRQGEIGELHGLGGHASSLTNFAITGDRTGAANQGITIITRNVQVSNGVVDGVRQGVVVQEKHATLSNVQAINCSLEAFHSVGSGTYLGDYATFVGCKAVNTTGRGWRILGDFNTLIGCTATGNTTTGVIIDATADNTTLIGNDLTGNAGALSDSGTTTFLARNRGVTTESFALAAEVATASRLRRAIETYDYDDFTSGANSSGTLGKLGWIFAGGTVSLNTTAAGHPGILRRQTGATAGTYAYTRLSLTTLGHVLATELFDITFIFRLNTNDPDTLMRVGLGSDSAANPPANGIYFEKLAADTSWFGVTRSGGVETRTPAVAAVSTAWVTVRLRRINGTTIGFSINGGAEVNATATIPTSGLNPFWAISNVTAVDKHVDMDLFETIVAGLVR